jgi:hypothetical protein
LDELRTTPFAPTAANSLPFHATPVRFVVVFEVRAVQVTPSGDVVMIPVSPTATRRSLDVLKAMARRAPVTFGVRGVHVVPSGLVRIVVVPQVTKRLTPLAAYTTWFSGADPVLARLVHVTASAEELMT